MGEGSGGNWLVGAIVAKLVLDKSGWTASVNKVLDDGRRMAGMSDATAKSFKNMGTTMSVIGGTILGFMGKMVKEAAAEELAFAAFEARLKSTGGVAGYTRDQMYALSESLAKTTTFTNEEVLAAESLLLTFRGIGSDVFPKTIAVAADLSKALGVDLQGATMQLGKALSDPVAGMTSLRRMGVTFTADQKKVIKALVDTGQSAKAQGLILDELTRKFGGTAAAEAATFSGQLKQLKKDFDEIQEAIGYAVLPMLKEFLGQVKEVAEKVRTWVEAHPELVKALAGTALKIGAVMAVLGPLLMMVPKIIGAFNLMRTTIIGMSGPFAAVVVALLAVGAAVDTLINKYKNTLDAAMKKEVEYGNKLGTLNKTRHEAIRRGVIDQQGWADLVHKFGGDYAKVYNAIATDPAYAKIKTVMDELKTKQDDAIKKHKEQAGAVKDEGDAWGIATPKIKTWGETLKEYGVLPVKDKADRIAELLGYEDKLNKMLEIGTLDSSEYGKGIKKINDELKDLGSTTVTQVLPPARDFSDIMKKAPGVMNDAAMSTGNMIMDIRKLGEELGITYEQALLALYQLKLFMNLDLKLPDLPFSSAWVAPAKEATSEMGQAFDQLWSDVASGFGGTFKDILSGATSLKDSLGQIWGNIKDAFFSMLGEIVTKWVKSLLTDMVGTATTAAASTASAFGGLSATVTGIATSIGGIITTLATAIGTAIGTIAAGIATAIVAVATAVATAATVLAAAIVPLLIIGAFALALYVAFGIAKGLLDKLFGGGGGSKERELLFDIRNFLAEIRNNFNWTNPILTAIDKSVNNTRDVLFDCLNKHFQASFGAINTMRTEVCKRIDATNKILEKLRGGARGLITTGPELIMAHGTPSSPEILAPLPTLQNMMAGAGKGGKGGAGSVTVNVNGQMITDRDYVRQRLIPEIIKALDSHFLKPNLQRSMGVA